MMMLPNLLSALCVTEQEQSKLLLLVGVILDVLNFRFFKTAKYRCYVRF